MVGEDDEAREALLKAASLPVIADTAKKVIEGREKAIAQERKARLMDDKDESNADDRIRQVVERAKAAIEEREREEAAGTWQ